MENKLGKCKYCGATIRWGKTKNNNHIPCNPKAIYYIPDRDGDIYVLTKTGEVVKAREGSNQGEVTRVGFIPHFATCSAKTRKKRKSASRTIAENAEKYRKKRETEQAKEAARIMKRCAEIQAAYEESQRIKQLSFLTDDYSGWARR